MKILMAGLNTPYQNMGGTQTWMLTMAIQYEEMGFSIDFWSPKHEPLIGIYDLGIFAHIHATRRLIDRCKKTILITHGVVNAERPSNECDVVLATSEEVRDHWNLDCEIIRQPIDLDFWSPGQYDRSNILYRVAYRKGKTQSSEIASKLGYRYKRLSNLKQIDLREHLRNAKMVHASGRAALEAMACGAPTLIYDHREQYQPELLQDNIYEAMKFNYSGRGGIQNPNMHELLRASLRAEISNEYRGHVETYHDAKKIAKELLCYS